MNEHYDSCYLSYWVVSINLIEHMYAGILVYTSGSKFNTVNTFCKQVLRLNKVIRGQKEKDVP